MLRQSIRYDRTSGHEGNVASMSSLGPRIDDRSAKPIVLLLHGLGPVHFSVADQGPLLRDDFHASNDPRQLLVACRHWQPLISAVDA